jgi:peptidoglycan-associated lipoprotein
MSAMPRISQYLLALGMMALSMPLAGCKKPEYPLCKKDKHCVAERGEKCVEGTCQNCKADTDCVGKGPKGENWTCHEFLCKDPSEVPAGAGGGADGVGNPCTQSFDCIGGLVCKAGACAACSEDFVCQPGTCNLGTGRCEAAGGAGQCQTDDQCAMDEICDMGSCVFSGGYGAGGDVPCGLTTVYFEFDSPSLKPETQEQLKAAAECLKGVSKTIILEAHADSRGTEEYNIMLTDRRGQAVREYLQQLGVDPNIMQVISKGDLEATGTDDATMSKDRRVDFKQ